MERVYLLSLQVYTTTVQEDCFQNMLHLEIFGILRARIIKAHPMEFTGTTGSYGDMQLLIA